MNELALFAGTGGGILGTHLLGWRTVAAVEIEDYPRRILLQRQGDGILPRFPIWDDVRTFDGKPWRGKVDVITGGFPCQDISAAGKGEGITGERSGLWGEMARIINEVRPRYVFAENSPLLISRGLGLVLRDLATMGFSARWGIVGAHHAAAPHWRNRTWVLGYTSGNRLQGFTNSQDSHQADKAPSQRSPIARGYCETRRDRSWPGSQPEFLRVANGVANRVDRLKAIGNGQVPAVVQLAWEILNNQS